MTGDLTARMLLIRAADRIDALASEAAPAPWVITEKSSRYAAVVSPTSPWSSKLDVADYGGELVGESMTAPNRDLIITLRAVAEPLAAWLREEAADWDEDAPAEDLLPGAFPAGDIARAVLGIGTS